jgi:hypothetical protein
LNMVMTAGTLFGLLHSKLEFWNIQHFQPY